MSDRTFQTKYFSTFSDAKNRIYFKTRNETSRSDFSSKSRKKSSFETAAPLSYLNPCTKQVLQIQFARCCLIRRTVCPFVFTSNRLYQSPIRAGLHFYVSHCQQTATVNIGCQCPIRAGLHFYDLIDEFINDYQDVSMPYTGGTAFLPDGVEIFVEDKNCVNALYGRDCISTQIMKIIQECDFNGCQCPTRAGLHFYVHYSSIFRCMVRGVNALHGRDHISTRKPIMS